MALAYAALSPNSLSKHNEGGANARRARLEGGSDFSVLKLFTFFAIFTSFFSESAKKNPILVREIEKSVRKRGAFFYRLKPALK